MSIIITLPNRAPAILDTVLAEQFGTVTRAVNQARLRNPERFPDDFAFQLTKREIDLLRSQSVIMSENSGLRDVVASLVETWLRYAPWAYTEEGVAQISGILTTPEAIDASVRIMRLFRDTRQALTVTREALQRLSDAVLTKNPTWRQIVRYKRLGLNHKEIGRLVGLAQSTVRRHVRELEACGLLTPPRALPMMQQMTLQFDGGVA